MDEPINWHDLEIFHAVLEAGSFSGAARSLGLSQPTVGRHIEALERTLGKELFTRTSSGLEPSEIAQSLGKHAARPNLSTHGWFGLSRDLPEPGSYITTDDFGIPYFHRCFAEALELPHAEEVSSSITSLRAEAFSRQSVG